MNRPKRFLLLVGTLAFFSVASAHARPGADLVSPAPATSSGRWSMLFETAQLFGINNVNDYHLAPQILSLGYRSDHPWRSGPFEVAAQYLFSAIGETVLNGPENRYLGGAVRVRLHFTRPGAAWSLYIDGGAGVGAIDSTDARDAQGQDLTFNLLFGAGVRRQVGSRSALSLGIVRHHLSNGGLSEPERRNVGLDSVGPSLGFEWHF